MSRLRHTATLFRAAEKPDALGRPTRNVTTLPCGCWSGEVYRTSTLAPSAEFPEGASRTDWSLDADACPTHAGAIAVVMLQASAGFAPLPAAGPHIKLLANAAHYLAEAAALDAELVAIGAPTNPILRQFGAASGAADMPQLAAPVVAKQLPPSPSEQHLDHVRRCQQCSIFFKISEGSQCAAGKVLLASVAEISNRK